MSRSPASPRLATALAAAAVVATAPAPARAALPVNGARFAAHDHETAGAGWHVEVQVGRRDATRLRMVVLHDEACGGTLALEDLRLTPEGTFAGEGVATAQDRHGKPHETAWRLTLSFATPHELEGAYGLRAAGCHAGRSFAATHGGPAHLHAPLVYADPGRASPRARRQAWRLLDQVRASAARRFGTFRRARARGFHRRGFKDPAPGIFHLWHSRYFRDERHLDARRPESLVYWKASDPALEPLLVGFMFRVPPGPRPAFAGSIPAWHAHKAGGDQMTHVWRTSGPRSAYANCLPVPELERALPSWRFEPELPPDVVQESRPCADP